MLPGFPTPSASLPDQEERMRAMDTARREMSTRLNYVYSKRYGPNSPPATRYLLEPDDNVLVYQERQSQWTGPYEVTKVHEKDVFVKIDGVDKHYNHSHVLPDPSCTGDREVESVMQGSSQFTSKGGDSAQILITEALRPRDPRSRNTVFDQAKAKELEGLARRGV